MGRKSSGGLGTAPQRSAVQETAHLEATNANRDARHDA